MAALSGRLGFTGCCTYNYSKTIFRHGTAMILFQILFQFIVSCFFLAIMAAGCAIFAPDMIDTFKEPAFRWFMLVMLPVIIFLAAKAKTPSEPLQSDSVTDQHPAKRQD